MNNSEKLIEILVDKKATVAERDDAAIDLSDFDDDTVLKVLIEVARDVTEEYVILASCGESITEILLRRNLYQHYQDVLQTLTKPAYDEAISLIQARS